MNAFTILPKDQPSTEGRCSRCGEPLTGNTEAAEWNGIRFEYCQECIGRHA